MADEIASAAVAEVPTSAPVTDAPTQPVEPASEAPVTKEAEENTDKAAAAEATISEGATTETTNGTPAADKKEKRKSTGGVPEHMSKKLNKKKSMPVLRLDCKPGDYYWARLKGYPPWPSIICDEQMLPESLLASRPVSAARPDGSLREDFEEGGKNAKERTFPVMFLHTNEFSWMVNTNLTPLDPEECKTLPKGKMSKALQEAYSLASEGHGIKYFKDLLKQWQEDEQAIQEEMREQAEEKERLAKEKAEKAAEKKKKAPRKSKGGDDDVDMDDPEAPKSSKKRKKETESDGEGTKPKKTPKVTKLNGPKTPNGETPTAKKTASKPKKKVAAPKDSEEDKPEMTESEKLAQREKAVLYLRHRLQKGFLARDQAPQESEMANMADFFTQLEAYENLEPAIIRTTKVHKVLKAIVKLSSVPKDEEFNFKKRSASLLENWNKRMESEVESTPAAKPSAPTETAELPATNGTDKAEGDAEKTEEIKPASMEPPAIPAEKTSTEAAPEAKEEDVDVSMMTAPEVPSETA